MTWHTHTHGDHEHRHDHDYNPLVERHEQHSHGWHSRAETCSGDDTFGFEAAPRLPSGKVAEQLAGLPLRDLVVTPYVPGMLKTPVHGHLIDVSASQYDYWDLVCSMCERGHDFAIIEQDNVPPPYSVDKLFTCPELWCGHSYQTLQRDAAGNNVLAGVVENYGDLGCLGVTAIKGEAVQWLGLVLRGWGAITWSNLDGMVYRALKLPRPVGPDHPQGQPSEGLKVHRHMPDAQHLHEYRELVSVPTPPSPSPP